MLQYWWKLRCMRVRGKQASMILSRATSSVCYHYMFDILAHVVLLLDMCQGFWTFSGKHLNRMESDAELPKVDPGQWKASEVMSLVCISLILVHQAYCWATPRIFGRSVVGVPDASAAALVLSTHFARAGELPSFYSASFRMAVLLRGAFALWRIARIYAASQVLCMGDASSQLGAEHDLIKNGKFRVLWIARGGDGFAAQRMEFEDMMTDLLKKFNRWRLDLLFALDVYLTGLTPAEEQRLRRPIQGSAIESRVRFERPDGVEWAVKRMSDVLRDTLHSRCATTGSSLKSPSVGARWWACRAAEECGRRTCTPAYCGWLAAAWQEESHGTVEGKPKARLKEVSWPSTEAPSGAKEVLEASASAPEDLTR
ncbi:unnamed protein product [Prorocentrum cordatum]|uniref:Sphingomyelin synthase-like domain-containing protein n=1 Tax=Prorocentrum cordatum TaxID=2364126 RepID=A0ABN9UTE5_9DINO|nr:unnamed protein product [Polarella glacialis]